MEKQITGGELALKGIFSKDYTFEIPSYQRPYAWTTEEVGILFDDLYNFFETEKNEIYFLGSIVLIKKHSDPKAQVVDGQQRLTTLTILFSVIASLFRKDKLRDEVLAYVREPGIEIEEIESKPRLRLREQDRNFFEKYIQGENFEDLANSEPKTESQKHIKENAFLILKKLKEKFVSDGDLLKFTQFIATRCYLVVVATSSQQSAFRVFSVMNSRGLDLLPCDIVKADIIGAIKDGQKAQKYTKKWEELEDKIGRVGFNELFGHIRMIYARMKAQKNLLEEFRTNVLSALENKEPTIFIDKTLEPLCNAYYDIKNSCHESSMHEREINDNLRWLNKINNSDWIPVTIFFFSKYKKEDEYILWFVKKLERLAAYLHITANDLNARILRYAEIIKEIKETESSLQNRIKSIELTSTEQARFIFALDGDIYYLTPPRRNYAILRLDSFLSGVGANYDYSVLTIEHVLPQTLEKDGEWEYWWGDVTIRLSWLNKIANLVPLARKHNSAAQNYTFDRKKNVYFSGTNGVTPYALTTQVNSEKEWTPDTVIKRQQYLLNKYIEKWELADGQKKGTLNSEWVASSIRNTSFEGQLSSASTFVQETYKNLCDYINILGDDIIHDKLKFFASFKKGKNSFVSTKVNKAEIIIYCKINFTSIVHEDGFTRNLTGIGHVCNYNPCVELTVRNDTDFDRAKVFIERSYDEN